MRYRINHVTRYSYGSPISLCHSIAHLKPREGPFQRCRSSNVRVSPWPSVAREHRDLFGNRVSYFSIQQAHSMLEVTAISEVEVVSRELPNQGQSPSWEEVRDRLRIDSDPAGIGARAFTLPSPSVPLSRAATDYARGSFPPGRSLIDGARDLTHRIYTELDYDPTFTTVATPITHVLEHRRGVCQDFAHVAIAGLRGLGLAARYVSGYLETLPPPGQPKLRGADASHAWFAIFLPGQGWPPDNGWIDLDPTNDCFAGEQHITTAVGRDYRDVTPVRGVFYGGGEHQLTVAVDVDRLRA